MPDVGPFTTCGVFFIFKPDSASWASKPSSMVPGPGPTEAGLSGGLKTFGGVEAVSRRGLYKLEFEYRKTLENWSRIKNDSRTSFRTANLLPPSDLPIQGLLLPVPPRRPKLKWKDERNSQDRKGKKDGVRNLGRFEERKEKTPRKRRFANGLCRFCDFSDLLSGACLVKRVKGVDAACIYNPNSI
ncbi:MAG: hypothetical protein ACE5NN_03545 [Candidatus Bathyarchaeia archaeon]